MSDNPSWFSVKAFTNAALYLQLSLLLTELRSVTKTEIHSAAALCSVLRTIKAQIADDHPCTLLKRPRAEGVLRPHREFALQATSFTNVFSLVFEVQGAFQCSN